MKQTQDGYLVFELMITVGLIALVVGLTVINFSFINRFVMRSELDKLYSMCCYAQQYALSTNSQQVITFNRAGNSYCCGDYCEKLSSWVEFGVVAGTKGPPADPKEVIEKPITFVGEKITFSPLGIIQPGTVYLKERKAKTMYALSSSVAQVSYLRKYRYDSKWRPLQSTSA